MRVLRFGPNGQDFVAAALTRPRERNGLRVSASVRGEVPSVAQARPLHARLRETTRDAQAARWFRRTAACTSARRRRVRRTSRLPRNAARLRKRWPTARGAMADEAAVKASMRPTRKIWWRMRDTLYDVPAIGPGLLFAAG